MTEMPMPRRSRVVIFAGAMLAMWPGVAGLLAMAEDNPASGEARESKGLLVAPATANGSKPAQIQLDIDRAYIPANAQLELAVEPTAVSNENYVVVISTTDGAKKEIGTFSFYPPPREGKVQRFLVDAQPLVAAMKDNKKSQFDLSVQLVPVNQDKELSGSALRVLGARLVGG
jgi:hypothetical protein